MSKLQFRVLYREFLFRMVDLEVLSAHALGDANKLLGQFAALLLFFSTWFSLAAFGFAGLKMAPAARLAFTLVTEHFLIATTMLVVGLFAVLSWDSTFPDRRDVLVLAPLPVRARTMFLAKVAAVATALSLTVALLHGVSGLIWPLAFAIQATPQMVPAQTFDATPAPVSAADLQSVLNRDLRQQLTTGGLAPGTGAGVAIGVRKHGERRVFAYGTAKPESLFQIGSITKTFTGLMLAQMVVQGKVALDEPIRLLADSLCEHIRQRLAGEPAESLDAVFVPASRGILGGLRWFAAYWFTMLASGVFIYCGVLGVQGLAAQLLPRRLFLRVSGLLQMAAFCLFVSVYFLQPGFGGLEGLTGPEVRRLLGWLPSYWFLGLFHDLNGSMHPALAPLARRAWTGLAIVTCGTAVAYALSYLRTLRKIVEEPDITPGSRRFGWLPPFGNRVQTAIGQFSVRTLGRSRQHRVILAFYLGIGFAFTIFLLKAPAMKAYVPDAQANDPWRETNTALLAASIVMMALAVVGTRVVFALPLDLRANWIFRAAGARSGPETLAASRRALLLLSVAPVWLASAVLCLRLWPWRQAAGHLVVLGLLGLILADLCLHGFRKLPFTCSYLPGKSQVHMVILGALGLMYFVLVSVRFERDALREPRTMAMMMALFFVAAVAVRLGTAALARGNEEELRFEEEAAPAVLELGLHRDGVMPMGPADG